MLYPPPLAAPLAVFDLDGTLADTAHDLVATLNVVLERDGLDPLPLADARDLIGAGGRALIGRGLAKAGKEATPDHLEELYVHFLAHYGANLCTRTRLYPGALEALDRLEDAGFRLAVCTNKMEAHSVKLLDALGIADRFVALSGRDTFPYFKPDPRHLTLTVERAGGRPDRAVMVGDSRSDVAAAQAAGVPVVAVTFGYSDVPVAELGPDAVIDGFDELYDAVRRVMTRAEAA